MSSRERVPGAHLAVAVARIAAGLPLVACSCALLGPDRFGNYDLAEDERCPVHGRRELMMRTLYTRARAMSHLTAQPAPRPVPPDQVDGFSTNCGIAENEGRVAWPLRLVRAMGWKN